MTMVISLQTMHPVLLYGQYEWDANWLPADEFEARLRAVRRIMADHGWHGLVVHGDSQENGLLCYLSNFIPNQRWALALIAAEGPPRLIASVGPRDLPAVQKLTWLQDIRASSDIAGALGTWLQELFAKHRASSGAAKIGFANLPRIRFDIAGKALDACRGFSEVEDASSALAHFTIAKRPREIALLRLSYRCLHLALGEVERVRGSGGDDRAVLLAAERHARMAGAQDVRILCGADGLGRLRPIDSQFPAGRADPATLYFALRRGGYWAEALMTLTRAPSPAQRAARQALEQVAASARAGVTCRELFRLLEAELPSNAAYPLQGSGIRRAGGLSLDGEPWMQPDSDEALVENGVYTIVASAGDDDSSPVSMTILARAAGREMLWPTTAG